MLQSYVPGTVAWGRGIYDPKLEVENFLSQISSSVDIFLNINKKIFSPDPL